MSQEYEKREDPRRSGGRYTPSHLEGGTGRRTSRPAQSAGQRPQAGRKKKKRAGPLGVVLYLVFVLGLSALLAGVGWVVANDVLALNKSQLTVVVTLPEEAFTSSQKEVEVTSASGAVTTETEMVWRADMDAVADILKENGLIEFKWVFKLFAALTNAQEDIVPGTYELNTEMDYRALISGISDNSPNRPVTTVTITEGMTVDQIFTLLEEKGVCSHSELQSVAASHAFKFSFLQDIDLGDYHRLEGYLFPDTYQFYMGDNPLDVLNKMILRFDQIFTDEMRAQAQAKGYTVADIVNIASMIEKETDGTDRADIASVIYNRLNNPSAGTNGLLQIDATILYVTGGSQVDTSYDTPYNTYKYKGLPPGPISNPGEASIKAALEPNDTSYFYYALGDDNKHHFFSSNRELEAFIASQERYNGTGG